MSFSLVSAVIFANWLSDVPDLDISKLEEVSQASIIYDKDGNFVTSYSSGVNKQWANTEEIPDTLKEAFVSIEDKAFYEHHGIYTKRLLGAILGQLTGKGDYGGSTITQQLIKNVYLTPEVSYKRKAQEMFLAKKLESKASKNQILESYMNVIYLGGPNYGVKSAALDYFGKDLKDLSLKECALIAGLAKNPNGFNPKENATKGDLSPSYKRANDVLFAMHQQGKISDNEYNNALNEEFKINKEKVAQDLYPYPHFIEYMINEVAHDLVVANKLEPTDVNIEAQKNALLNGGYKIYSSLDVKAQDSLQSNVHNFSNYPKIKGEGRAEAAAVIIDNKDFNIAAMVGGRDVPTVKASYNRATHSAQPVGSILKPLAIFGPAIDNGAGSGTVELDFKTGIPGYDNNAYPGGVTSSRAMTMRETLESSHNIPAARFLYKYVGPDLAKDYLLRIGINNDRTFLSSQSLVLGTSNATVLEMARAYTVFPNNGQYLEPKSYLKVEDRAGNVLIDEKDFREKRTVFDKATAWILTDMMVSEVAHGTGKQAKVANMTTGGKTGTHEDRVVTYAGMTPYYTGVVRISSDSYLPMENAWGGTNAAQLFSKCMTDINKGLKDKPIQSIDQNEAGVEKVAISKVSGDLSTDSVKAAGLESVEYYKKGYAPKDKDKIVIPVCKYHGGFADKTCWDNKHVIFKVFCGPGTIYEGLNREDVLKGTPNAIFNMPVAKKHVKSKPKYESKKKSTQQGSQKSGNNTNKSTEVDSSNVDNNNTEERRQPGQ